MKLLKTQSLLDKIYQENSNWWNPIKNDVITTSEVLYLSVIWGKISAKSLAKFVLRTTIQATVTCFIKTPDALNFLTKLQTRYSVRFMQIILWFFFLSREENSVDNSLINIIQFAYLILMIWKALFVVFARNGLKNRFRNYSKTTLYLLSIILAKGEYLSMFECELEAS